MKKWYYANIEDLTIENWNFREVLYTAWNMQLVLMCLPAWEEIWLETHYENDQFFRFETGNWKCIVNDNEYDVADWDVVIIPAWSKHNIINTWDDDLKMYTIYATPHHKDWIIHETKEIAEEAEENGTDEFEWETTES